MTLKKFFEKPFRLMSIVGMLYIVLMLFLNFFTSFSYEQSIMPYAKTVSYVSEIIALILCAVAFLLYNKHFFYYAALEIIILSTLYTGRIYTALFLSSFLFVLMLYENRLASRVRLGAYLGIEIIKLILVVPYGVGSFFEYIGIMLFSLCSIGCINLLFRHAYSKNNSGQINLDDYKFTDRQKDCIKETVLNNTTIKALAITHKVSESAIKKDFAHIYHVLGITGKADLKALFINFDFQKL